MEASAGNAPVWPVFFDLADAMAHVDTFEAGRDGNQLPQVFAMHFQDARFVFDLRNIADRQIRA